MKLINIEIEGLDYKDCPDFVDAYLSYAEKEDGTPLTEEELDKVTNGTEFYNLLIDYIY